VSIQNNDLALKRASVEHRRAGQLDTRFSGLHNLASSLLTDVRDAHTGRQPAL
jgi:hypothetical protein